MGVKGVKLGAPKIQKLKYGGVTLENIAEFIVAVKWPLALILIILLIRHKAKKNKK
jgi:hypothetical protein